MMQLTCPHCQHSIEYSADRPRFCSFCGETLSTAGSSPPEEVPTRTAPGRIERTQDFDPTAETLPPQRSDQVATLPTKIAGYRVGKRLGGGGMGSVYEGEHVGSGQRVALKLIRPECLSRQAIERFKLEGKLASSIAHPRCVFVLAADTEGGQPYIVMELMPGSTLTDLVLDRGPLPAKEAITKILDVIEGLQEAHRLGVIHRDVKPSNCFLDVDGRVKVGDFGLAKMQDDEGNLTRTGSFVGTVLFASPEQIKRQPLDRQADVYSVAATLYFLLTGQAPFSDVDALAATARIVSEDPPSMRKIKPELPEALDRVVLRGLEREKSDRWPDLESFRLALKQFLPGQMTVGALGYRFGALVIDWIILTVVQSILWTVTFGAHVAPSTERIDAAVIRHASLSLVLSFAVWLLYFSLAERLWGCTIGKWMFRLRVSGIAGEPRPSWLGAFIRSAVFFAMMHIDAILWLVILAISWSLSDGPTVAQRVGVFLVLGLLFSQLVGFALKIALPLVSMRRHNGYRGPHEFASATRVLELREQGHGPSFHGVCYQLPECHPLEMPRSIGTYKIHGAIRWDESEKMLVGDDPSLGRRVWIWLRSSEEGDVDSKRRELSRPTRIRWVGCGQEGDWKWDAFLAPNGFPLAEGVRHTGPMSWPATVPILRRLTDELKTSLDDRTVPTPLIASNVWVDEIGRMQLVGSVALGLPGGTPLVEEKSEEAALNLIGEVAALCLEGKARDPNDRRPIQAPIPRFAAAFLNKLWRGDRSFPDVATFQSEFRDLRARPTHVTRPRRVIQVVVLALLAMIPFSCVWLTAIMFPVIVTLGGQSIHEQHERNLEFTSNVDLAAALVQPNPWQRIQGVHRYADDLELAAQMKGAAKANEEYTEARRQSINPYIRWTMDQQSKYEPQYQLPPRYLVAVRQQERERLAEDRLDNLHQINIGISKYAALAGAIIIPLLWILWGFLTRGGLILYFSGMELVRRDGRKASFLQCLARGLLFFAPLMLVLGLSAWCDIEFWTHWHGLEAASTGWLWWLSWLSWLFWWAAIVLLAVYLALTLWRPERAWYDRAVGIWIVPR